jgi:mlo protein
MAVADEGAALQFTPTWIVAAVCTILVLISLAAERGLHHLGKVRIGRRRSWTSCLLFSC